MTVTLHGDQDLYAAYLLYEECDPKVSSYPASLDGNRECEAVPRRARI